MCLPSAHRFFLASLRQWRREGQMRSALTRDLVRTGTPLPLFAAVFVKNRSMGAEFYMRVCGMESLSDGLQQLEVFNNERPVLYEFMRGPSTSLCVSCSSCTSPHAAVPRLCLNLQTRETTLRARCPRLPSRLVRCARQSLWRACLCRFCGLVEAVRGGGRGRDVPCLLETS